MEASKLCLLQRGSASFLFFLNKVVWYVSNGRIFKFYNFIKWNTYTCTHWELENIIVRTGRQLATGQVFHCSWPDMGYGLHARKIKLDMRLHYMYLCVYSPNFQSAFDFKIIIIICLDILPQQVDNMQRVAIQSYHHSDPCTSCLDYLYLVVNISGRL